MNKPKSTDSTPSHSPAAVDLLTLNVLRKSLSSLNEQATRLLNSAHEVNSLHPDFDKFISEYKRICAQRHEVIRQLESLLQLQLFGEAQQPGPTAKKLLLTNPPDDGNVNP